MMWLRMRIASESVLNSNGGSVIYTSNEAALFHWSL
jgi:hypothetical protein